MLHNRILAVFFTLSVLASLAHAATTVSKSEFGKMPDGRSVDIYTLKDGAIEARITTYGARIVSLLAPDKNGKTADITLGYDNVDGYVKDGASFGSLVGRYAGRIGNATFNLDGKDFHTPKNDGPNTLHGGPENFGKQLWTGKQIANGVELTYVSKDGEAGFPGTLTTVVRYTLIGKDLKLDISAATDKDTVLNLTNHAYWNLAGEGSGDVAKQEVQINAAKVVPVNDGLIPTGKLADVAGTPLDLRKLTPIGAHVDDKSNDQLKYGIGYDITYVLDNNGKLVPASEAYDPASGRVLTVLTDQPGLHFYSGNHMDGVAGKGGHKYAFRNAYAFEAQNFSDAPNQPNFPSAVLKPGQKFHHIIIFRFSTK
ncbi:aldose 1-epimerase [Candidatus Koribacter versatilis Ellin345]|uniref:Aldose 1-epimerase n=1 Tax=Koribacter versatilis (strain Ellin345) TaxID=204669 RepID=Q1ISK0_KORVE|nr:aldose epimerase family protein [Candidatus Koribacter versatilis]ABF40150.1 aldose 1-epimerase [Candidatus Koribacter versatilis Ellin345]